GAEPALPGGLGGGTSPAKPASKTTQQWLKEVGLTGFVEFRGGVRTGDDRYEKDTSIGEGRAQLDFENVWKGLTFKLVTDFLYDPVLDHHTVRLDRGQGWLDLRQANVAFSPTSFMDVKIGRQILTWGTGDLIFINDLFPKDWQAFFIGRDVEYLKAPSDALKMSFFSDLANLDVVFTPCFDADRFIRGERLSYWNGMLGRQAGRDAVVRVEQPNQWFRDEEWAVRLSKNVAGYELAAYGYWGYWKSPGGMDPMTGRVTFPRLSVYGASARGQLGRGIANVEAGYYDSRQDRAGDDPFVNNSQLRLLVGYEQDLPRIARDLTVGLQYYVEVMMHHDEYLKTLPPGAHAADADRHVLTFRVTKLLLDQNLTLSLFAYYSPTDSDAYIRPSASYKIDDHWTAEVGGNVFFGLYDHTFFGQFDKDTNVYVSLRYGF
ncbi:MAG: hypothetical protein J7M21_04050, partial [Planctomycetes bacterium]|nr:hypothetical protein [Planctomycetota bacterium]